ncbi:hypothetical protein MNBD_NITROSPINAE01-1760 [hydrothermal vent metagenome]|uniref:Flagellar protein FlaG n=1 Tax=hydrothermal vent metagenome TaxID=652676 RepID=A0A3B1CDP2_9ZZZZ
MDVRDLASTGRVQDASARLKKPQAESAEKVKPVAKQPVKSEGTVVKISTKSGEVVEKNDTNGANSSNASTGAEDQKNSEVAKNENAPKRNAQRIAYSVEEGDLVVKVIDTAKGEVVKEIPAEDERRIRQAISKFTENAAKGDSAQGTAKGIDVTS